VTADCRQGRLCDRLVCLRVIPAFLERSEDRKPDVYEYASEGMAGKRTLDLSWVTKEQLRGRGPKTQ
jgi:hypothetical protein